jgi:glutamate/tyrosine decarboxylase-like PLP-dependent enzyme
MSLAVAGWEGYAATLRQMTQVGQQLRRELEAADWDVVNSTELPICCFQDRQSPDGRSADYLEAVAREVVASGDAWISTTRVRGNIPVLRACITSYRTNADDLRIMVSALNAARAKLQSGKAAKTARTATPEA